MVPLGIGTTVLFASAVESTQLASELVVGGTKDWALPFTLEPDALFQAEPAPQPVNSSRR